MCRGSTKTGEHIKKALIKNDRKRKEKHLRRSNTELDLKR